MARSEYRGYIVYTHPAVGSEVPAIVAEVIYLNRVVWQSEMCLPSSTARAQEMARKLAEEAIDAWLAVPPSVTARELAEQALGLELAWLEQGPLSFRTEEEMEKLMRLARRVVQLPVPEPPLGEDEGRGTKDEGRRRTKDGGRGTEG